MERDIKYKITIPKTRPIPILEKCGMDDSTKEAMTIEVKTTKARSRKNHNKKTPKITKTARTIVPVDMEIEVEFLFSNIRV